MTTSRDDRYPTLIRLEQELSRLAHEASEVAAPRRRWVFGVSVAAFAAAAALVLVALLGSTSDNLLGASPAQAEIRQLAERVNANGDDMTLSSGDYLYQREFHSTGDLAAELATGAPAYDDGVSIERWTNRDGSTWTSIDGSPRTMKPSSSGTFGPGGEFGVTEPLSYEQVLALPRQPEVLYTRLKELAGATAEENARIAAPLAGLLDKPLPLDLQSALLDAAALAPDAVVTEGVVVPHGEPVTAISFGGQGISWELLFDPSDGAYRGRAVVLPDGHRFFGSLILDREVVASLGDRS